MNRYLHSNSFGYPGSYHISYRSSSEIVEEFLVELCVLHAVDHKGYLFNSQTRELTFCNMTFSSSNAHSSGFYDGVTKTYT
jgi:hypothetical protein